MFHLKIDRIPIVKNMLCSCESCCDADNLFSELQKLGRDLEKKEDYLALSSYFSAIASKQRLIILNVLKERDMCVCELEAILDKSQSTISHHLSKLKTVGLIRGWKKGNYTYYGLNKEIYSNFKELFQSEFRLDK